jgi:hypothetical protein
MRWNGFGRCSGIGGSKWIEGGGEFILGNNESGY